MGWEKNMDDDLAGPSYTTRQPTFDTVDRSRSHRSPPSQWSSTSSPDPTSKTSSSNMPLSCVARETSQDDCSYSRFLAWAAVRRNSCRLMSSSEKLSCPLHQCRKQFQDHETMLKHLAACQYLATREYWCYDHMRLERFDDAKCKRCISHPSRRRKMLSMAKTFFSTLGNKSKRLPPEFHFDIDDTLMMAPPSYHESLSVDPPAKPELPSTEILEIDSTEVTVPQTSVTEVPTPAIDPQALLMPELDSTMIPMLSGMQWQPTPYFPPSTNNQFFSAAPAYESLSAARPASQDPSQGALQNRQAPRSKNLSPSSSVRSTTSTMSNVSNISNVSNVSSVTTTSSLWSASSTAWSGLETNMTSLSGDESFDDISKPCPSDPLYVLPEIPELEADMPPMSELPSGDYDGFQDTLFSFDGNLASTDISYPDSFGLEEDAVDSVAVHPMRTGDSEIGQSETKSLVALAWEALKEHIISSQHKTKHVQNPLADQLRLLSAETIAARGLGCLRRILDGDPPTSPLDTLCLVHVVYSLSLAVYGDVFVYGDDATRRSHEFFVQSLLYATWFTPENQTFFRDIAKAIWQPSDMADEQLNLLLRQQSVPPRWSRSNKGKEHATKSNITGDNTDPLILAAQNFLDELEISAVLSSSSDTLASGLRAKHSEDASKGGNIDDQVTVNARDLMNVLNVLVNRFHDADGLIAQLSQVNTRLSSGVPCSTRRFELEALQVGKSCIVPVKYFDDYVPLVRSLCDPIYELDGNPGAPRRQEYYSLGIALSEEIIAELNKEAGDVAMDADAISEDETDHDDLFASLLTPPLTDDLVDMDMEMQPLLGLGLGGNEPCQRTFDRPIHNSSPSNSNANATTGSEHSPTDFGSSSNHATQTPSSSESPSQQKIEADAGCELCGYRPKGDPRWFHGSMAKHKKLQHSTEPPKIYRCSYPGCNSAYKNRPDNLRQHQLEKNHFVEGQDGTSRRPSKRRKMAS
ncbi:hypothetical protein VMCG_02621 [Cytospora schulzeri]|uniref:Uncharacterized protein n=1 Tax=Cytospora schulzeri TaxID=448051 RepID=A0A423X0U6_9PEZI|nr:hypothetical protein VMCG_02621 [Valsa malicola]